ncbi:cytochrome c peroxidase [Roseovarius sp. MBR-154]
MLNAVFNEAQFWDGRAADLAEQAKGPVEAGVEMANTPDNVLATLNSIPQHVEWFEASFPEEAAPVSFYNFAKAIEAYEATLITPAPFDAWLNGVDGALSDEQVVGLELFMDKGCSACHNGVNLGGNCYYPFGLIEKSGADVQPPDDRGRFAVTETADDSYVFRAAPLRNIDQTAPYFHSGKVWDLKVAVQIMGTSQLGTEINEQETDQIVAFLGALTGRMPEVVYPVLPAETLQTPRPTGDVRSLRPSDGRMGGNKRPSTPVRGCPGPTLRVSRPARPPCR